MIKTIQKNIEAHISSYMKKAAPAFSLKVAYPSFYDSLLEYTLRKGKRIRPLLFMISYKGYLPKNKRLHPSIYNISTAIEFLHNFMLIHDDIIDQSHLRRGKPTMHQKLKKIIKSNPNEKLGIDLAIIAGDIIYALAINAFLSCKENSQRKEKALKYFIETTVLTAMGECIDTIHGLEPLQKLNQKDVFLNYSLKTARYTFIAPLVTGALLAGAPPKEIKKLTQLGLSIGQAFQIQDDIIGIFDTQKNIGKSILSDLAESKKTLLVCHAYKSLTKEEKRTFSIIFNKPKKTFSDLQKVRKLFIKAGTLNYCFQEINQRLRSASSPLNSLALRSDSRKALQKLIFKPFLSSAAIAKRYKISFSLDQSYR